MRIATYNVNGINGRLPAHAVRNIYGIDLPEHVWTWLISEASDEQKSLT